MDAREHSCISTSMALNSMKWDFGFPAYKIGNTDYYLLYCLVKVAIIWEIHCMSVRKLLCI